MASRLALVIWAILSVLALGRAALAHLPRHQGGFDTFADAGQHWLEGADLYDKKNPNSLHVFRYSPLAAVLCVPLGCLPLHLGNALLRIVNLAIFLSGSWWFAKTYLGKEPGPRWGSESAKHKRLAVFFLLLAAMANNSLMDVQFNLLTTGLLLLGMAALGEDRFWIAALALALAILLKAYTVSLVLLLVLVYPRKFGFRCLAALVLGLALPFLFQNPAYVFGQYGDWLRWGLNARYGGDFQDFMLLWNQWLPPMSRATYTLLEILSGLALAAVVLFQRKKEPGEGSVERELLAWLFGLCSAWMMVLGPSTESTTYVLLAPAVALAVGKAWHFPSPRWLRYSMAGVLVLLTLAQLELIFPLNKPTQRFGGQALAGLVFLLSLVFRSRENPTGRPGSWFDERDGEKSSPLAA